MLPQQRHQVNEARCWWGERASLPPAEPVEKEVFIQHLSQTRHSPRENSTRKNISNGQIQKGCSSAARRSKASSSIQLAAFWKPPRTHKVWWEEKCKREEMNALIIINKHTEDNQPSKKLQPASRFMSSAPAPSWTCYQRWFNCPAADWLFTAAFASCRFMMSPRAFFQPAVSHTFWSRQRQKLS